MSPLTIAEVDERIKQDKARRYLEANALPQVPPLTPGSRDHVMHMAQERKRQELRAQQEAAAEQERIEREAAEADRQQRWAENAEAREAARAELEQLEPALQVVKDSERELRARRCELQAEINRWAPLNGTV
jgi:hypothetical protein